MWAVTVRQPHASWIADEIKPSETRSWMAPKRHWGTTIGIHASKYVPTMEELAVIAGHVHRAGGDPLIVTPDRCVFGAVIATATLVECVQVWAISSYGTSLVKTPEGERRGGITDDGLGDYSPGRWVWLLSDVKKLAESIPACGYLGLWRLKDN